MAKAQLLTATKVRAINAPGFYSDGDGLRLRVSKHGSKTWVYRYQLRGKRRDMGLGSLDVIPLAKAREARNDCKVLIAQGIDPLTHRQAGKTAQAEADAQAAREAITFAECAEQCISVRDAEWCNAKHAQQWSNTLETYAYPFIGSLPVCEISKEAVLACLSPIWTTKTETATRVRQRIEAVLDYAKAKGYRDGDNPAAWRGNLKELLPDPTKLKDITHHAALDYADLPAFMSELRSRKGIGASALRFCILTAARSGEIMGAKWSEIDYRARLWIIPKERMKGGKEHRVPLSPAALELLESLPKISEYIFPGQKAGKPISNGAMPKVLKNMKRTTITVHGFRSTFRDWAAEKTNYPARVAETALAHQLTDKAQKAYNRSNLVDKRRGLMEAWAGYCDSHKAKVVKLHA